MKDETLKAIEESLNQLGTSMKTMEEIYPKVTQSVVPLSYTGVSPRNYFHWKKSGLIHSFVEGEEEEREWVRLNLVEYLWIKIIQVMRDFGVPIKVIKETKEIMFSNFLRMIYKDKDSYFNFLKEETKIKAGNLKALKKLIESLEEEVNNFPEEFEIHHTIIGSMVCRLFFVNEKSSIVIAKDRSDFKVTFLTSATFDETRNLNDPLLELTHLEIPIRVFFEEFLEDSKSEKFIESFELLNLREKKVIEAIRKKDFKEITIRMNQSDKNMIIEVEKDGDLLEQKAREVRRILGLNEYEEVTIKYRNDKHLYFKNKTRI